MSDSTEPCRLIVVLEAGEGAAERLAAARQAADIATLVLRAPAGRGLEAAKVVPLVAEAQKHGIAVLLEGDARLARTVKADGVHVPAGPDVVGEMEAAREQVGGRAIVGADAGRSRDDAMRLGEGNVEYVAFGAGSPGEDPADAHADRVALIAWWAEIFEVPCVAFDVETPAEAGELAAAGADFVAVTIGAGLAPAAVRELARDCAAALATAQAGAGAG